MLFMQQWFCWASSAGSTLVPSDCSRCGKPGSDPSVPAAPHVTLLLLAPAVLRCQLEAPAWTGSVSAMGPPFSVSRGRGPGCSLGSQAAAFPAGTTLFPAPQPLTVAHPSLPPKAAGGRLYPVSVPYSSAQSTSKTSVTLSLVMPSQGQLVNGAHSASTLDEATPTLTK